MGIKPKLDPSLRARFIRMYMLIISQYEVYIHRTDRADQADSIWTGG